jgi:pyruvate/2-oxoglutarate dehydrogenase complex dihydrolipoamide acyltransferase (E2) component
LTEEAWRIAIEMPNLGYDTALGTLSAWLKQVGDRIERGEAIVEVETEGDRRGQALDAGTLVEIVHGPGDEVAVGDAIAWLENGAT